MKKTYLAMGVALIGSVALAQAQPFSQTYFLGDSLSDSGQFMGQRFTTNPGQVWAQHLATEMGTAAKPSTQNGTNYAVGGARVGVDTTASVGPTTVPVPSMLTQMAQLQSKEGRYLDGRALYSVWGGANDLFAVVAGAPAQDTISKAVVDHVTLVSRLSQSGANYILVPNIPDLGSTPAFKGNEAAGTTLANTYNKALYEPLAKSSINVIPLDVNALLNDAIKRPQAYGIKNATTPACGAVSSLMCGPAQLVEPNADQTYLFADGVHPTSAAQKIIADYAVGVLTAPAQMAVLGQAANQAGQAQMQHIDRRLYTIAPLQDGKTAVWVQGAAVIGSGDGMDSELDGTGGAGMIGVDKRLGDWTVGTYIAYDQLDGKVASKQQYEQQRLAGGLYGRWQKDQLWFNGQLYYADLDVDTRRQLTLGQMTHSHEASGSGDQYGFKMNTGWHFQQGAVTHGPLVGMSFQKTTVNALRENGNSFTGMSFDEVSQESLQSHLGYQVAYQINPKWQTQASLQWQHEFKDGVDRAGARLNSMDSLHFYVPVSQEQAQDSGVFDLGVNGQINDSWHVGAGVNAQFGDAANAQTALYVNTSYRF